jgi:hypothetical protein
VPIRSNSKQGTLAPLLTSLRRVFLPLLLFHCFFLFLIWRIHIIFYPRLLPVWSFLLVTRDSRVKEKEKGQVRDEEWKLDSEFLHMRS